MAVVLMDDVDDLMLFDQSSDRSTTLWEWSDASNSDFDLFEEDQEDDMLFEDNRSVLSDTPVSSDNNVASVGDNGHSRKSADHSDYTIIPRPSSDPTATPPDRVDASPVCGTPVLKKIEAIFDGFAASLLSGVALSIPLTTFNKSSRAKTLEKPAALVLRIPMTTSRPVNVFAAVVLRLLELMHEAMSNGVVVSKRDMYYRDPALFGNQATVDRHVDAIARTFDVPRSALPVIAVAKGLILGSVTFLQRDGNMTSASRDPSGMLVPPLTHILSTDLRNVKWILVIEKEASFRTIASSSFWSSTSHEGILMTGKGYPDIASRALLHLLSTPSPRNGFASPRILGLADFDPDGLAILSVYRHGSAELAHEGDVLKAPRLEWLGLRSEHVMQCVGHSSESAGMLDLTARDRRKACKMLQWNVFREDGGDEDDLLWRAGLQTMLMLNVKAELQLFDDVPRGLEDLLSTAMGQFDGM